MFKRFLIGLLIVFFAVSAAGQRANPISPDGRFRGIFLGGRVAVVSEPSSDVIRVKVVYSQHEADLLVYPHSWNEPSYLLGQWNFVSDNPAFRIMFVSEREDIRIQFVDVLKLYYDGTSAMRLPWDTVKYNTARRLYLERKQREQSQSKSPSTAP